MRGRRRRGSTASGGGGSGRARAPSWRCGGAWGNIARDAAKFCTVDETLVSKVKLNPKSRDVAIMMHLALSVGLRGAWTLGRTAPPPPLPRLIHFPRALMQLSWRVDRRVLKPQEE